MKNLIYFSAWLKKYSIWLILFFATVLRLWELGKRDFWYDEAFTGIAVKESWAGMIKMIMADVHPPLYYLSLKLFAYFFDYNVFGIRLFSVIFGILCVWAVYLFTKELFNKKAALYASFIAAISPFAIQYSKEGRMYSMFAFFIIIAAYFLVKGQKVKRSKGQNEEKYESFFPRSPFLVPRSLFPITHHLLFGFFLGLATLTHYMGIFFAPIFYAVYVIWNFSKGDILMLHVTCLPARQARYTLQKIIQKLLPNKGITAGYAVAFLIFLPWFPNFVRHVVKNATSNSLDWIRPANFGDIAVNIQMFIFGTPLGEMSSGMPGPNEFYGITDISMWVLVTVFMTAVVIYLLYSRSSSIVIPSLSRDPSKVKYSKKAKSINFKSSIFEEAPRLIHLKIHGSKKDEDERINNQIMVLTVIILSLGFMVLIWFLGFFGKYYFVARYLLPAGYFIFVLLGVWLSRIRFPFSALAIASYIILLQTTIPLGYSTGWNELNKNLSKYENNNFYILNAFDYVIAKYYLGAEKLTLYNVDWPPYNPDYWAAIGPSLKRTEEFSDLRKNKNNLIISNTQLGGQDNVNFDPTGLKLMDQYENILIYKFASE